MERAVEELDELDEQLAALHNHLVISVSQGHLFIDEQLRQRRRAVLDLTAELQTLNQTFHGPVSIEKEQRVQDRENRKGAPQ